MNTKVTNVAVVGAGTMGLGIAQSVAMAGCPVLLYDVNQSILDKAITGIADNLDKGIRLGKVSPEQREGSLRRIEPTTDINKVVGDLIIVAVVEDLKVKHDLFLRLESLNEPRTIFATNTSSISVTDIGSKLKFANRLAGLHFFNPAHIMKLVEIVQGAETEDSVVAFLTDFADKIGKIPVHAKDAPGFIVNRVARHYYLESLRILEEQVADHQDIDNLLESSGFRMGPFKLMDLIGVDVNLAVTKSIYGSFQFNPKYKPSKIQQALVEAGHLGRKSGKGFYSY